MISDSEAKPFTGESAKAYYQALKTKVSQAIKDILSGWKGFNKLGK